MLLGELPEPTSHPKIQKVNDPYVELDTLELELKNMDINIKNDEISTLITQLKKLVSHYNPSKKQLIHSQKFYK